MFAVREVRVEGPRIVMTLETEDVEDLLYVSFLRKAAEFAQAFSYRVQAYGRSALRDRERAEAARTLLQELDPAADRSRLLALFRALPADSPRRDRLRTLRGALASSGRHLTVAQLGDLLAVAAREERAFRARQVETLLAGGKSARQVARETGIPRASIGRLKTASVSPL